MSIKTKIVAGKLKGRSIELPDTQTTRPTKSIIRESFFNVIGREIYASSFVEGFAGSGSMGIEALSRGCKEALFFEQEPKALATLKKNLATHNLTNAQIFSGDSFTTLVKTLNSLPISAYWLYLDPPFHTRKDFEDIYKRVTQMLLALEKEKIAGVCIEHSSLVKFPSDLGDFHSFKSKKFGKTTLTYYR